MSLRSFVEGLFQPSEPEPPPPYSDCNPVSHHLLAYTSDKTAETENAQDRKADVADLALPPWTPQWTPTARPLPSLPPKILSKISNSLPRESQACLALTNKSMFTHFGMEAVQFIEDRDRRAFLDLIGRDRTDFVYCPPCRKLHDPMMVYLCRDYPDTPGCCPPFNMVHAFMRNVRAGRSNAKLLPRMSMQRSLIAECKVVKEVEYQVVRKSDGQLYLSQRTDDVLELRAAGRATPRTIYELGWALCKRYAPCAHVCHRFQYPFLFPDMSKLLPGDSRFGGADVRRRLIPPCQVPDEPLLDLSTADIGDDLRCVLSHHNHCPLVEDPSNTRSCHICSTDFRLKVIFPEDSTDVRKLKVTVWRTIGTGERRDDPVWVSRFPQHHGTQIRSPLVPGEHLCLHESAALRMKAT